MPCEVSSSRAYWRCHNTITRIIQAVCQDLGKSPHRAEGLIGFSSVPWLPWRTSSKEAVQYVWICDYNVHSHSSRSKYRQENMEALCCTYTAKPHSVLSLVPGSIILISPAILSNGYSVQYLGTSHRVLECVSV